MLWSVHKESFEFSVVNREGNIADFGFGKRVRATHLTPTPGLRWSELGAIISIKICVSYHS